MTSATRAQSLRKLRILLGISQEDLGRMLGVGERTVVRIESGVVGTGFDDVVDRVLWLINETRVEDSENLLRALLLSPDEDNALLKDQKATFQRALQRLKTAGDRAGLRLKDLRVSSWVYWATGARAAADETLALARDEGLICRPVSPLAAYLPTLAVGDLILLCHNATPLGWFRLRKEAAIDGLPPVFRLVDTGSALGQRLAKGDYRLSDGALPSKDRGGYFSCLSVDPTGDPLESPTSRGRGIRDTMTPFIAVTPADN